MRPGPGADDPHGEQLLPIHSKERCIPGFKRLMLSGGVQEEVPEQSNDR